MTTGGAALGRGAETATQRSPSSSAGIRQRGCPGSAQAAPRKYRSLGSERGLATPSPDGKGEITLSPSMKIMPVDPYNTLGRSCEPAYQVDCRREAARRRHALAASGWSGPGRPRAELLGHLAGKAHPRSSLRGPGPYPATDGRGRGGTGAPRGAKLRYSPARRGALSTYGQFWLTHRAILPLRADRPRQRAFRDVPGG